jgi:glycosyltransferase involved in cell wall biosynthesis
MGNPEAKIKISVLTSCFNCEKFIGESIESVLSQTYRNFEYLLVDDGSTDRSRQIMKKYADRDSRIYCVSKKHTGLTDSLNFGLGRARGKWVARLDADDIALPFRFRDQLNFVEANLNVSLLGGGCIEIDEFGIGVRNHRYPSDHNALMKRLRTIDKYFPHSSAFFNRQIAKDLGGYNQRFSRSQDLDLWLRIGKNGKIACLDAPVIKLRKHGNMISNTDGGRSQALMAMCAVICYHWREKGLSDPSQADESTWRKFLNWLEQRMEEEGLFQEKRAMNAMMSIRSRHVGERIEMAKALVGRLVKNPNDLKIFWPKFVKRDLGLKLAKESEDIV